MKVRIKIKNIYWLLYGVLMITLCADGDNRRVIYATTFLMFLLTWFKNWRISKRKLYQPINIWYFLFLVFALLSVIWSIDRTNSLAMTRLLLRQFLVLFSIGIFIEKMDEVFLALKIFLAACTVMMVKINIFMMMGYSGYQMWDLICGNYFNTVAQILAIAIAIAYYFMIRANRKTIKAIYLLFIIYSLYHIFITGSRKGLLMPFVEIVIFMVLQSGLNVKKILKNIVIAAIAIGVMLYVLAQNEVMMERLTMIFDLLLEGNAVDESSLLRMLFIELAGQMFYNNPLLGCGINTFASQCELYFGRYYYSHNNFFEILSGTGIIGFVLYYWFYGYSIYKLYSHRNKNMFYMIGIGIWITLTFFEYGIVTYSILLYPIILTIIAKSYQIDVIEEKRKVKVSYVSRS